MYDNFVVEDARSYNQAFIERLKQEGVEKTAAQLTDHTRQKIREESFCRPILNSQPISPLELDVSEKTRTPVKFVDKEPDSKAYAVTFRGKGESRWFEGERYRVDFTSIKSEVFKCTLAELATYRSPIRQILHDNYLLDVREQEDKLFYDAANAVVNATGNIHASSNGFVIGDLVKAAKKITNNRLIPMTILLSSSAFESLKTWPATQVGDQVASETIVNGWKYEKIGGYNYVRTVKTDIIPDGELYIFTAPEFLGKHYVLNDVQVFFKQEGDEITFWCWEDIGMGFGNSNAISKMTWAP